MKRSQADIDSVLADIAAMHNDEKPQARWWDMVAKRVCLQSYVRQGVMPASEVHYLAHQSDVTIGEDKKDVTRDFLDRLSKVVRIVHRDLAQLSSPEEDLSRSRSAPEGVGR